MKVWRQRLKEVAGICGDLLAVFGILILIYGWYSGWDRYLERVFPEPDATVRPICERVLTGSAELAYEDGESAVAQVVGLHIKVHKDVDDLRFGISGIHYAHSWGVDSNALSPKEISNFHSQFPSGNLNGNLVTGSVPRLMSNTETYIQAYGVLSPSFDCNSDWFNVSSVEGRIFLLEHPTHYAIRNMSTRFSGPGLYKILFWLFAVPATIYALYVREQKRKGNGG